MTYQGGRLQVSVEIGTGGSQSFGLVARGWEARRLENVARGMDRRARCLRIAGSGGLATPIGCSPRFPCQATC